MLRRKADAFSQLYLSMPDEITIDQSYKPAPQLQIDSKSRAAAKLYAGSTTIFFTDKYDVCQWLHSLSLQAFKNMRLFKRYDASPFVAPPVMGAWGGGDEQRYRWATYNRMWRLCDFLSDIEHRDDPKIAVGEGKSEVRGNVVEVNAKTGKHEVVYRTQDEMWVEAAW